MIRLIRPWLVAVVLCLAAGPAAAQWNPVPGVKSNIMWSVWTTGDTIAVGSDLVTYVSIDGGASFTESVPVTPQTTMIRAVVFRNGRLYAGTDAQGVFFSDDLGQSWTPYNEGLVGGIGDSQLHIAGFTLHDDHLIAATVGAGAWIRDLSGAGGWTHFGDAFEIFQASNMDAVATGGTRLFATGGFNGIVFWRDPGDADWTPSPLNNVGFAPGLAAPTAIWTGHRWVVGTNIGVFHSPEGREPWTRTDPGLGLLLEVSFALDGPVLYASFDPGSASFVEVSRDDGVTWQLLESVPSTLTLGLAVCRGTLYAARVDGLWRRTISNVAVPSPPAPPRLQFAIAGAQPARNTVRFRLDLGAAQPVTIEVFDVSGRRVAEPVRRTMGAGSNEIVWDAGALGPGVYLARASAGSDQAVARLVHVR